MSEGGRGVVFSVRTDSVVVTKCHPPRPGTPKATPNDTKKQMDSMNRLLKKSTKNGTQRVSNWVPLFRANVLGFHEILELNKSGLCHSMHFVKTPPLYVTP